MKRWLLAASLVAGLAPPAAAFDWSTNLDRARAQAREENKLVLLDFSADWCPPCRAMDAETWVRPDVAGIASRFVCVRNDFGEHGSTASDYYHVDAIPTLLILDRKGQVLLRVPGFRSALDLAELLEPFPTRQTQVDSLVDRATRATDPVGTIGLAGELTRSGLFDLSGSLLKRVQRSKPVRADSTLREQVETLAATNLLQTDPTRAIADLENCLKRFPGGRLRRDQLAALVRASAGIGLRPKAEDYLRRLQAEFPDDTLTRIAERRMGERE